MARLALAAISPLTGYRLFPFLDETLSTAVVKGANMRIWRCGRPVALGHDAAMVLRFLLFRVLRNAGLLTGRQGGLAREVEIVVLRRELVELRRTASRPRLDWADRAYLAALASSSHLGVASVWS